MDIRIEKTEKAIKAAFLELREQKPLEKLKVKELCEKAQINKSTFYAHYQDIYALSQAMEQELVRSVLGSLPPVSWQDLRERPEWLTRQLFRAFQQNSRAVNLLFSGSREGLFVNRIESGLRELTSREDPDHWKDPVRSIVLSFCVQGSYYAFSNNIGQMDAETLVEILGAASRAAQNIRPLAEAGTSAGPDSDA